MGQKSTWQTSSWLSGGNQVENQNLIKENLSLKEELIILKSQAEENVTLRAALGISQERKENIILADVLNKDFLGNFLLVNKGSKDKITKGLAVITPDGALVGKVEKVYNNFSQIILITAASSSFEAEIQNETGVLAVVKGNGSDKISFELVPQEQILSKGNLVKTIALGNAFPKDILVGEVLNFEKESSSSFQKGSILPYFLRNSFKQLLIIIDEK
ncbi:MAG: rod shape-determining protein MreC [Candidatus Gribaldobacteria bacterium]|nr:rod shape-determining protein MreC [Candidatus Gribaldobacteria bacterium]